MSMDSSSTSLLDLLSKSSATKKTSDKDQLLALFGQAPQIPPASSNSSPMNRNSNANDLLAALMGTTSPKPQKDEKSASLLSALMATSRSPYKPNDSDHNPSHPQSISDDRQQSYTPGSYVNPRHEYLSKPTTPARVNSPDVASKKKAFFSTMNPFDELERVASPSQETQTAAINEKEASAKKGLTTHEVDQQVTNTTPRHISTSTESGTILRYENELAKEQDLSAAKNVSIHVPTQVIPIIASEQTDGEVSETLPKSNNNPVSVHLPADNNSSFRLSGSPLTTQSLGVASPVTKMSLKFDPLNKNIIAASLKYIAYQLSKESDTGLIRIVDQETGETSILSHHTSKVVNLAFARAKDEDGHNALLSTDLESNIVVWSLSSVKSAEKTFEIAGPSDTSHKSRAKWNDDGTYFGVAITSRIYVFDYRSLKSSSKPVKVKLHPDMKQVLCICKSEKAIRDYSFSLDHTSLAGIDKTGSLKLWNLESTGKTCSALATITLGDRSLTSITFAGHRHAIVGVQAANSILLIDIQAAKCAQEVRLPASKNSTATRSKLIYLPEKQLLLTDSASTRTLYFLEVELPQLNGQKTSDVVSSLSPQSSHIDATGRFKTVAGLSSTDEVTEDWLDFTAVNNDTIYDVYIAHEKGYTLYNVKHESLTSMFSEAVLLGSSSVSKMQNIGSLSIGDGSLPKDEVVKSKSSTIEQERSNPSTLKMSRKGTKSTEQSSSTPIVTEPRTAELAAKIEANLKVSLATEFQKSNAAMRGQIEKLQSGNDARHETVLRLVSETLSRNTTQVLKTSINEAIEQSILPTIKDGIDNAIASHVRSAVTSALSPVLSNDLIGATRDAVQSAFDTAGLASQLQAATTTIANDFASRHKQVEQNLAGALIRMDAQFSERQKADSEKIASLVSSVKALEKQVELLSKKLNDNSQERSQPQHTTAATSQNTNQAPLHQNRAHGVVPQHSGEDYIKYHDLIMEFVAKSQKIAAGDLHGVPFIRQFLSWQPEAQMKDDISKSLGADQLHLLAFVHALASELGEEDAFNRVHWIGSASRFLTVKKDPRLDTLGPQLMSVIYTNLSKALERAPVGSRYRHLLEVVLSQIVHI